MTDERVAWLTARLDELERLANATIPTGPWYALPLVKPSGEKVPDRVRIDAEDGYVATTSRADGEHIVANDPRSVLARVEADRYILRNHCPVESESDRIVCQTCDSFWVGQWPCPTFTALLSAYQYRSGFDKEWLR